MRAQPKKRPEFNSRTKRAYTPKKTEEYEERLKWLTRVQMGQKGIKKFDKGTPLKITVLFTFKPTESWSKKRKKDALAGLIHPTLSNLPDVDNALKAVLDALNEVAYDDDKTIIDVHAMKKYAKQDSITVILEPVHQNYH